VRGDGLQVDDRGEEGIIHIKHGPRRRAKEIW
jgi:hypothetical protein